MIWNDFEFHGMIPNESDNPKTIFPVNPHILREELRSKTFVALRA